MMAAGFDWQSVVAVILGALAAYFGGRSGGKNGSSH